MANDDEELVRVLEARLGSAERAKELAKAYLDGVRDFAVQRTTGEGGVPTTLVGERVEVLLHISKRLGRLITEREISAFLRVNPGTARRLHVELRSVHEDTVRPFVYLYALQNAKTDGKGEHDGVRGVRLVMSSKDQMEALLLEAERTGVPVVCKRDEDDKPWLVYVDGGFDLASYGIE
jgi:hypothetical protein